MTIKKPFIIFTAALLFFTASFLSAQTIFYGDYSITAAAVLNENDYESALNPGNIAGMDDVSFQHAAAFKLSAGDTSTSFELWAGLQQQLDPAAGLLSETLNSLSLRRAGISFYAGDYLKFQAGRISMLTGYGYGWNPSDFANPLKDPADPEAELSGVDTLLIHFFPDYDVNFKAYALIDASTQSIDYSDIRAGGELSAYLPFGEAKITGLYDYDEHKGEDAAANAVGAALYLDIAGVGVYGEGALLDGSRTQFADPESFELSRKDEILFNALGGIEYSFIFGLTAAAEYYYNGEGYNRSEMASYTDALTSTADSPAEFAALAGEYRQGNYSRHYVLLNLIYPVYAGNIEISSTALLGADSGTLAVLPRLSWWASGGLSVELGYSGIFDLSDIKGSEAALSPAAHIITLTGRYSF